MATNSYGQVKTLGLLLFLPTLLAACDRVVIPAPTTTPVARETVLSRTSSLSHVYVLDKESGFVTCAEPPPDTAFDHVDDSDFSMSLIQFGNGNGAGGTEGNEEAEMIGRTPGVLITRELFFRTCEFSRNYDLSKEEALALFRDTLATVKGGWTVEGANTTVRIDESEQVSTTHVIPGVAAGSHSKNSSSGAIHPTLGQPHTTTTHRAPTGHTTTTHHYPSGHSTTIKQAPHAPVVGSTPKVITPAPTTTKTQ